MADKKRQFLPPLKGKWLLRTEPLEPVPLGPYCKRWYKTREPPNYLATQRGRLLKCPMDTRRWVSVREGRDDFRTGCPPADNLIIRGPGEGFLPTIAPGVPRHPPRKTQKELSRGELLSRLSAAQQTRKAFVEEIDASLSSHPLAGYDLKECLPSDLLLKVLEELDADKMLEDTWAYCEGMQGREKSPTKLCEKCPEEVNPRPMEPSPPGASSPGQPRPPKRVAWGPAVQVKQDLLDKSTGNLSATSNLDIPTKSTRDCPAKSNWELLVKSSWDLLAKSSRTPRTSKVGPPGKVNRGTPKQVNWAHDLAIKKK